MDKDNMSRVIGALFFLVGAIIAIGLGMRSDARDNAFLENGLHTHGTVQSIDVNKLRHNTCYHPVVTFTDDSNTVMTVREEAACASKDTYHVGETVAVTYDKHDSTRILVNGHKSNVFVVWYLLGATLIFFMILCVVVDRD